MATEILITNNAISTLLAGIGSGAVTLSVQSGKGALYAAPTAGQIQKVTLFNTAGLFEIVHCTARSGDTLTVVRGQDGTTPLAWNAGDGVIAAASAGFLNGLSQLERNEIISGTRTFNAVATHNAGVTNNAGVSHVSTDASATVAPSHDLYRNSASPAATDGLGAVDFNGNNASLAKVLYARIVAFIYATTAAAENGYLQIQTRVAGTITSVMTIFAGVQIGTPAGGDKGAGTLNAQTAMYVANVQVATVNQTIGGGQTWQNVLGSRGYNTNYTNSTGRPIQVSIGINSGAGGGGCSLVVGGIILGSISGIAEGQLTAIVPSGAVYQLSTSSPPILSYWAELS